jgi:hypothetical protein
MENNSLLLTYLFPSQPSPLQSSVNNAAANGFLNVVVSAQGQSIYAEQISIYLPIGVGVGNLTNNQPIGTAQLVKPTELPPSLLTNLANENINYVLFSGTPQTPADQLLNFDLQFSFQVTGVDSTPGPYMVGIVETASTTQGGGNQANGSFFLTKAAATFILDNLTVSATGGDVNVPFGSVPRNSPFILSWESNGNLFNIFTAQGAAPIYTGTIPHSFSRPRSSVDPIPAARRRGLRPSISMIRSRSWSLILTLCPTASPMRRPSVLSGISPHKVACRPVACK